VPAFSSCVIRDVAPLILAFRVPLGNKVRLDFLVQKVKKAGKVLWVRVTLDLLDSRDRKVKRDPRGIRVFPVVWVFQV